ncbi:MAG: putative family thiol-disulfide oxidoreductase YuxK [Verrucomicrobiaceae bacterium]|nr:putative family thiol-disulfide oxidoreductase YuxK [Verrucomicrobiaceae bacterium]
MENEDHPVVLFDGVCNFCNGAVQFLIRHDPRATFRFAAYQSPAGNELALRHGIDPAALETFAVVMEDKALLRSDAAIATALKLGGFWRLAAILKLMPRALRDAVYGLIARNRYRWFGRRESCMVPDADVRRRFLG